MTQSFPVTSSIPPSLQVIKDELNGCIEEVPCINIGSGIGIEPDTVAVEMEALAGEAGAMVMDVEFGEDGVEAGSCRGNGERLGVVGLAEGEVDRRGVVGAVKLLN